MAQQTKQYTLGTGRRKTSVARVRLSEGTGKIIINDRTLDAFFTEVKDRGAVTGPLLLLDMRTRFDVTVRVHGGGITGQAGAIKQGIARALKRLFKLDHVPTPAPAASAEVQLDGQGEPIPVQVPELTPEAAMSKKMRESGFLTRDSRMKERKKYGRKGARKSFQFSKR